MHNKADAALENSCILLCAEGPTPSHVAPSTFTSYTNTLTTGQHKPDSSLLLGIHNNQSSFRRLRSAISVPVRNKLIVSIFTIKLAPVEGFAIRLENNLQTIV